MRRFDLVAMSLVALCCGSICTAGDDLPSAVGKRVEDFTLPDVHGKPRSLAEFDGKVVVLAFIGTECPLAKSYSPRLRDLAQEFEGQGVIFLGIDSNMQDTLSELAAFARATGIGFPMLKDTNNELADRLGAGAPRRYSCSTPSIPCATGGASTISMASRPAPAT